MSKTGLSVGTALVLFALSAASLLTRWLILGPAMHGPRGASSWAVTLVVAGDMTANDAMLTIAAPPDFRRQHIFDIRAKSKEFLVRQSKGQKSDRNEITCRRANPTGPQPFRLTYSFHCLLGMRGPNPAMAQESRILDAAPKDGAELKSSPLIECEHKDISQLARALLQDGMAPLDQAHSFFDMVNALPNEPSLGAQGALECLNRDAGDPGGKARLFIALCRTRGIPARLLSGLILEGNRSQGLHYWAEAWINDHWLPVDPTYHHFGARTFPSNYLIVQIGEQDFLHSHSLRSQYGFLVQDLRDSDEEDAGGAPPSRIHQFLTRWSLYSLRPAEQHLIKFLLLMPLAALIVCVFRTVIGVPTFGTFSPALLGLAFLDLKALRWGLAIFVLLVLLGWGMRRLLDRFHLLMVPRLSILLTLIVSVLIVLVVVANHWGVTATQYFSLFPLVILTHLVERFWTVETEDGAGASFGTLLGTMVVSLVISLSLGPDIVMASLLRYPEIVGFVLGLQFLLGRYTGYRISELRRFQDLVEEPEQASPSPAEGGPPSP